MCVTYESIAAKAQCDFGFTLASEPTDDVHFPVMLTKSKEAGTDEGNFVPSVTRLRPDGTPFDTVELVVSAGIPYTKANGEDAIATQIADYVIEKAHWHKTHVFPGVG